MSLANVDLDDKYRKTEGRIFISAPQALVRIPLVQRRLDEAAGLNTAGFISGYRGSPLGVYDLALTRAQRELDLHHIRFQPGVNEELAATAIYGSQQLDMYGPARYDGVFAMWYGKGPGVDRAGDALKHGNLAGSHARGGALVLAGDDHTAKSSTTAHQSEQALMAALIPVLYPADVQDYLDFGLYGFALSRFAGLWVGFKCVNDTADATASVEARPDYRFVTPQDVAIPQGGLNLRIGDVQLDHERKHVDYRLPAVHAFLRANRLDRVALDSERRELGIVTAGKAFHDVMEALAQLSIDHERARMLGIRVYKLGLTWPIEPTGTSSFCAGHRRILVVEEKRAFIEPQLKDLLYNLAPRLRPEIWGKSEASGRPLLPSIGELDPILCLRAIMRTIEDMAIADSRLQARIEEQNARLAQAPSAAATDIVRTSFFCSGCPHNRSTVVPEGSMAIAGIGCHAMAGVMPHRLHKWPTQMGGEGANWIGIAPFTEASHVFQNLGDGTYFHSGFLAIRAAVAAGTSITYKLLVNDAVAMTGGQPVEGQLSVAQMAGELLQEGVKRLVVVSDAPTKHRGQLPANVTVHHRDDLDAVQRELREIPGVTVLIYEQVCAAEKRRRRKRGRLANPDRRVFINDQVCEGCGDCSVKSNCVSVLPLETEFGRKREIDQSNCNKDFSCLHGFCPSFVTITGAEIGRRSPNRLPAFTIPSLPQPAVAQIDRAQSILITGIGGTGVVTVGAILGMAAHLEGKGCSVVDMTGMSQKNGAVLSHVKIAAGPADIEAAQVTAQGCDLLLACDLVVAGSGNVVNTLKQGETAAVVNTHLAPTAAFQIMPDIDFKAAGTIRRLRELCDADRSLFIDGARLAVTLMGDSIASNMLMLGVALQRGLLPVSADAIERAIELNGVAIEMNRQALRLGRWAAIDTEAVLALARDVDGSAEEEESGSRAISQSLDELIERRVMFLAEYQNRAWAERYRQLVETTRRTEADRIGGEARPLTEAVARYAFKLMAYKDEYEVARLHTNGEFLDRVRRSFGRKAKLQFHFAPPLLAPRDKHSGEPRKLTFGPWMLSALTLLAKLRFLRGTPFDPFGHTAERRNERAMIERYRTLVMAMLTRLDPANHQTAVEIASYPEKIRGYGHVKERHLAQAEAHLQRLLARYTNDPATAIAA